MAVLGHPIGGRARPPGRASRCPPPHAGGPQTIGGLVVPRGRARRRQRNSARRIPDEARCRPRPGRGVQEGGDLARRGGPAQRLLDALHDQQERDQEGREEDDAEGDDIDLLVPRGDGAGSPDEHDTRRYPSGRRLPSNACPVRIARRPRPRTCRRAVRRPPRARPARRVALRSGRDAAGPYPPRPPDGARARRDPSRRALRAGLHERRSSCSSPRSCRRRPPTRGSTR